jgi:DNA-binding HxlR family transcriptional regulator
MQNAAGPAFLADCPTRLAVEIISDKWAVLVLFGLSHQPRRHGELVDLIGGISRTVLTQTLRRLQQYGLVERHAEAPRRVEYSLTDRGGRLRRRAAAGRRGAGETKGERDRRCAARVAAGGGQRVSSAQREGFTPGAEFTC